MSDYIPYGTFGQAPPLRIASAFARALGIFERQWLRLLGASLAVTAGLIVLIMLVAVGFYLMRGGGPGRTWPIAALGGFGGMVAVWGLFGVQLSAASGTTLRVLLLHKSQKR